MFCLWHWLQKLSFNILFQSSFRPQTTLMISLDWAHAAEQDKLALYLELWGYQKLFKVKYWLGGSHQSFSESRGHILSKYKKKCRYRNKPEGMLAGEDTAKLIPNISLIYFLLILSSLSFPQGDLKGIMFYLCLGFQALKVYWLSSGLCGFTPVFSVYTQKRGHFRLHSNSLAT